MEEQEQNKQAEEQPEQAVNLEPITGIDNSISVGDLRVQGSYNIDTLAEVLIWLLKQPEIKSYLGIYSKNKVTTPGNYLG